MRYVTFDNDTNLCTLGVVTLNTQVKLMFKKLVRHNGDILTMCSVCAEDDITQHFLVDQHFSFPFIVFEGMCKYSIIVSMNIRHK